MPVAEPATAPAIRKWLCSKTHEPFARVSASIGEFTARSDVVRLRYSPQLDARIRQGAGRGGVMVAAAVLKTAVLTDVWVRLPPPAQLLLRSKLPVTRHTVGAGRRSGRLTAGDSQ